MKSKKVKVRYKASKVIVMLPEKYAHELLRRRLCNIVTNNRKAN